MTFRDSDLKAIKHDLMGVLDTVRFMPSEETLREKMGVENFAKLLGKLQNVVLEYALQGECTCPPTGYIKDNNGAVTMNPQPDCPVHGSKSGEERG